MRASFPVFSLGLLSSCETGADAARGRRNRDRELVFDPLRQDQGLPAARVRRGSEEPIYHVFYVFAVRRDGRFEPTMPKTAHEVAVRHFIRGGC